MAREVSAKPLPQQLLLKNVRLIDVLNRRDEVTDILIKNGKIEKIGKISQSGADTIDLSGKIVTHGFIDMHVHLREPGREDKETVWTGCNAAMAGGFTAIACMPNTTPPIDSPDTVLFVKSRAEKHLVDVYPVGCVSKNREGKELAEIGNLVEAGAVGISDDGDPVYNAEIMRRALEYVKMFDIPVIEHAEDKQLSNRGSMHEGFTSTRLGIRGIPSIAEETIVARDILLAEYTDSRVHIAHISSGGTVRLVREAKKRGIKVTCEVCPHHFTLTDLAVENYNTFAKMNPPLREQKDVDEIKKGLQDGTIDIIATDHAPHTVEDKECEFDHAAFGITGLETCVGITLSDLVHKKVISLDSAIDKLAIAPRKLLNLPLPEFTAGASATFTILDLEKVWKYDVSQTCSKSVNTPYHNYEMRGKAIGVIHKNKIFME
ncbi:dihydroorotase [bacterium]|nr:MAG: dihydroorotase [bacterium]